MAKMSINPKLSYRSATLLLTFACILIGAVEIKALIAKEPFAQTPQKLNAAECIRCHSDPKTIKIMRLKEDGSNYLFNSDGTFKDPQLQKRYGNYQHTGAALPVKK